MLTSILSKLSYFVHIRTVGSSDVIAVVGFLMRYPPFDVTYRNLRMWSTKLPRWSSVNNVNIPVMVSCSATQSKHQRCGVFYISAQLWCLRCAAIEPQNSCVDVAMAYCKLTRDDVVSSNAMQTPTLRFFRYVRNALVSAMCHRRYVRPASVCFVTNLVVSQEEVFKPVCGNDREPG